MSADLIADLVGAARRGDEVSLSRQVLSRAKEDPASLVDAALRLHARSSLGEAGEGRLLERIEQALAATPGLPQGLATMELARSWYVDPSRKRKDDRYWSRAAARGRKLASLLAGSQSLDVLLELLDRLGEADGHFEMLCLLVHEMVLAGVSGADHPAMARLEREMRGRGHPLAELPLHLLPIEAGLRDLPTDPGAWQKQVVSREPYPWTVQEVTREEDRAAIGALSEGSPEGALTWETRVFLFDPPVEEERTGELIDSFMLDASSHDRIHWTRWPESRILAWLFRRAGSDAWGRLRAWRSLAGLAGDSLARGLAPLEKLAGACRWFCFLDWSEQEHAARRAGLLCVRPTGSSAAVLAEL